MLLESTSNLTVRLKIVEMLCHGTERAGRKTMHECPLMQLFYALVVSFHSVTSLVGLDQSLEVTQNYPKNVINTVKRGFIENEGGK